MATRVKTFNRNNIKWAIQRAGAELEELLLSFPKTNEQINKESDPTVKQLERSTKNYKSVLLALIKSLPLIKPNKKKG